MNSRKAFLTGLFRSLDAKGIGCCVLRNYDDIFADATSDIDVIVEKRQLAEFQACLHQAAADAGHRCVHQARYVNHSHVFWNAQSGFVRIDFETEVRWRPFPILSAATVLEFKQRRDGFFVPHPRHESVILFLQCIWRCSMSDRYRQQLDRLYKACPDKPELALTYGEAFGPAGQRLLDFHSRISTAEFSPALCAQLRRSIVRKAVTRPGALFDLAANVRDDALRLWERLRKPAGISLHFVSSARRDKNFDHVLRHLEFLFPVQKSFVQTIELGAAPVGLRSPKPGHRLQQLRTLFKGGLFVRHYRLADDASLRETMSTGQWILFPSRAFLCLEDASQRAWFGHVHSGFMLDSTNASLGESEFSDLLIEFISTVLEKQRLNHVPKPHRRGVLAVLIGMDGSGKTTLASNLARLASTDSRFDGVRYHHWRPRLFGPVEFPFPATRATPRKAPLPRTLVNSLLSSLRLVKNVILANLAHLLRVKPLLARNNLVIIDRYFYNYRLDPNSVKYAGPEWLLRTLLPWFPKPDVVITLDAPAATVLARKQELSPEEFARQNDLKNRLDFQGTRHLAIDAGQPPLEVAKAAFAGIAGSVAETANASVVTKAHI